MPKKPQPLKVSATPLKVRSYPVMERAVEEGVGYGWRRAHKHTDKPDEDTAIEQIRQAVMNEICEAFDFGD